MGEHTESVLGVLVTEAQHTAPDDLPALVARVAGGLGARDAVVYVADFEQRVLLPLGENGASHDPLEIDHTLAGRAFRLVEVHDSEAEDGRRLWVPVLDGTARIGVLALTVARREPGIERCARELAGLVGELIVTKAAYSDTITLARRRHEMSLAAEMQWELVPPLTFSDGRVTVSGVLEPSYRVAGDTFDYALNGGCLHLAVVDAMGHGFEATMMATVAIGVYRHARRCGHTLPETYAAMDEVIGRQFGLDRFVTAQVAEFDTLSGRLQWLNAGHPYPLLMRGNSLVGPLECEPTLPVGFGGAISEVAEHQLEPGDRLLFVTDGVLEARGPDGDFFGEERLADFLVRETTAGLPAPETVRRLAHAVIDHQEGQLQDDATLVFLEWHGRDRGAPPWQA